MTVAPPQYSIPQGIRVQASTAHRGSDSTSMGRLINIDNGGTLTDIWVLDGEKSIHTKTLTTPYDLSKCFFEGLKKVSQLLYGLEDVPALLQSTDHIRYSTTQGTNALVMKRGPAVGLILGSEQDAKALGESEKESEMLDALVGDRVQVLSAALSDDDYRVALLEAVNQLAFSGANRIVVSYNGDGRQAAESRFRSIYLTQFPRHMLGAIPVLYAGSLSSDESFKRRSWTAINNSFLHPAMESFLYNAENKLREHRHTNPLLIYRNDGYSGRVSKTIAVKTYSSGPRAGMESAKEYAAYYQFERALTLDVGGTTSDIGLIEKNEIKASDHGRVEGVECSFPLSDIVSIGVGGGSIIRVENGALRVGPDSVGGAPGPVCFGLGGKEPTVTDALVVMGLLDAETFFGGEMQLDKAAAISVIQAQIAEPLGVDINQAVHRMFDAWALAIADGVADFSTIDDDTALIAFGGGGPMGALAVARAAGIKQVLLPRLSAVFSAHGIGFSDIAHRADVLLAKPTQASFSAAVNDLYKEVSRNMFAEGFELSQCELELSVFVDDQYFAIDTDEPLLPKQANSADRIRIDFKAVKSVHRAALPASEISEESSAVTSAPRAIVQGDGQTMSVEVVETEGQVPGASGEGPVVIEEPYWTCFASEGWRYSFTQNGDVLFRFGLEKES